MTKTRTLNKDECDNEVYVHGEVIGVFDMPKDKANELVVKLSKKTGNRIDWHYVGGRVVMKMLPPKASVNSRTLKSRNQREGWYAGRNRMPPDFNLWLAGRDFQFRASREFSLRAGWYVNLKLKVKI